MDIELKTILDFCMKSEEDKIQEMLDKKSKRELIDLFEQIIEDDIWIFIPAIKILIKMIYSDDERFVKILCKLIENTISDGAFDQIINPIFEFVQENYEKTLAIINKMIDIGKQGICTGIIISPLLGQCIIDEDIIHDLKSDNKVLQLHSLIGIREIFIKQDEVTSKIFIPELIGNINQINSENKGLLFDCFMKALLIDEDTIVPFIEKELDENDTTVAAIYIEQRKYKGKYHISLTKKALEIIETKEPESQLIDDALIQIYESDKDYVVEKLRKRLQDTGKIDSKRFLTYRIRSIDPKPVIQMLEEEIDVKDSLMANMGDNVFKDLFSSSKEYLAWCEKWRNDEKKENVILRSLSIILTNLSNYEDSSIRDDAILIVKELAAKKGLDYDKETKHINFGKDSHEGAKNKEAAIKALFVIKRIRFPYTKIDLDVLRNNLKKYPYLDKIINAKWLIKSAGSKNPHLLAYIYGKEIKYKKMEELVNEFSSEKDENRKLSISLLYNSLKQNELSQLYWENVFEILYENNLKISPNKIKDVSNAESFLTEAEVIARLARYFNVEIEPDIEELRPSNLDVLIEYNGEKCLIEIAQANESIELDVAGGVISLPGGKIKKILLSKFKKQLKMGKVDPKIPVIMVVNLMHGLNEHDAYDSIYGELQFQFKKRDDTHQIVEQGYTRKENSFYHEKDSDVVTAIATYNRDNSKEDPLVGKLHEHPRTPKNPLSKEFKLILRDALFGDSESSDWQSLTKIEGITEDIAKKLHTNGIEDLNKLAIAKEEELEIKGFDKSELCEFQKEARRVISTLITDSIRFLKGMNNETYNLLTKNGIYLIEQLNEEEIPKSIEKERIKSMLEDANRITN